jgi:hypothetical protein
MTLHNFLLVQDRIDPRPFLAEIDGQPGAWEAQTGRQEKIPVQGEAKAIPLRGMRKSMAYGRAGRDVHEARWTSSSTAYPHARTFLEAIAERLDARMGRAKLVLLPPGRRVYPHIDRGTYYRLHDRYHLVLQSPDGSFLKSGGEEVRMAEGQLWWFDNRKMHEAINDGSHPRIHLIFDLLPRANWAEAEAQRERAAAKWATAVAPTA